MKKALLSTIFAGLFALSACSGAHVGVTAGDPAAALSQIGAFTVTDLQAADADAVLHNDVIAHACYPALIKFVQSSPLNNPTTTVVGAFSAFQAARDIKTNVTGFTVPDYLKLGCAPLVMDVQTFLIQLAAIGYTGGVLAPFAPVLIH